MAVTPNLHKVDLGRALVKISNTIHILRRTIVRNTQKPTCFPMLTTVTMFGPIYYMVPRNSKPHNMVQTPIPILFYFKNPRGDIEQCIQ